MSDDIKVLLKKKRDALTALEAKAKPLRDVVAELTVHLAPLQAKLYDAQQALKAVEQPAMHDLRREIAALTQALPENERE